MVPKEAGNLCILSVRESFRQALLGVNRVQVFLRLHTNDLRIGYSTYLKTRLLNIVRRIQPDSIGSVSVKKRGS